MTGKDESHSTCPLCGGQLRHGMANVPFLFTRTVALVKNVPADICTSCHEPFASGVVTDQILRLLSPIRDVDADFLVISYKEAEPIPA
jgi:YgiT-type zinc finger domain-containing protein